MLQPAWPNNGSQFSSFSIRRWNRWFESSALDTVVGKWTMWDISKTVLFACRGKQNSRDLLNSRVSCWLISRDPNWCQCIRACSKSSCWLLNVPCPHWPRQDEGLQQLCGDRWGLWTQLWEFQSVAQCCLSSLAQTHPLCHIYSPWCCTFPELHTSVMPGLTKLKLGKASLLRPAPVQLVVLCCCFSLLPWGSWLQRYCLVWAGQSWQDGVWARKKDHSIIEPYSQNCLS